MTPDTEVSPKPDIDALARSHDLDDLRRRLDPLDFMAGWNKHEPSLWKEPRTDYKPMVWRWEAAKAGLDAAGRLIDAEQAERRNLFMVNPIEGNHYATLRTLVSAYQMLLPGEKARTHRHSPNAPAPRSGCGGPLLHHRGWGAHRHGAGRCAADAGHELARPWQ